MASSLHFQTLLSLLFLISFSTAQTSFRPKALVLPVSKDPSTLQYLIRINQRTPLISVPLTVDLGGYNLWMDCEQGYVSSSFTPVRCRSAECSLSDSRACGVCDSPRPVGCVDTCSHSPVNTVTRIGSGGDLRQDVVSVQSTDGANPGRNVSVPKFLFGCSSHFLIEGLAKGVKGMAGLGRKNIGMPSLFAAAFSFKRKFAICLSSSVKSNGVLFFGGGPYNFLPNVDASKALIYTPLIVNPVSTTVAFLGISNPSEEYFIGVKSIKIASKSISLNTTLLAINSEGFGGTKISTVDPYTVLETSIYKSVTQSFIKEFSSAPRVSSIAPFEICYNAKNIGSTRVGPAVPAIELVLQGNSVWSIYGANSMVDVGNGVLCLGFVDGGSNPRTPIVIGAYQFEDNFLEFDLASSKLGFSNSLFFQRTTCSNFNFTSIA